jgi:hypothetical protein
MTKDVFRAHLADHGYVDERVLQYDAHHTPDLHTHDFSAMGMVTSGALTIVTEDGSTRSTVGTGTRSQPDACTPSTPAHRRPRPCFASDRGEPVGSRRTRHRM